MADEAKGAADEGVDERVKSLEEALSLEKAKNEVLPEVSAAGSETPPHPISDNVHA